MIPQDRFDPVSQKYSGAKSVEGAERSRYADAERPINNLVVPTKGRYYFTRYDWKVDHQFSPSNKLFGRYSHMRHRSVGRFSNELLW